MVIALTALAWSVLSLALWRAGHQPSAPSPLFGQERAYLGQAIALPIALPLASALAGLVLYKIARALGGTGQLRPTVRAAVLAQGTALALALVVPDSLAYAIGGFAAVQRAFVIIAPCALFALWFGLARASVGTHALSRGRAILAALPAIVALGAILGPLVR